MRFLRREQHTEPDEGDNQSAGNTQTRDGDSEGVHHQLSGVVSHHHDGKHIDRGHHRLMVTLGAVHVPCQPQEERNRR